MYHQLLELNVLTFFGVCVAIAFLVSTALLVLTQLLLAARPDPEKTSAYECGFEPFEDAREKFDVRFYIVAILFLVFDVEIAFFFPWVSVIGMAGIATHHLSIALFTLILTLGFIYEIVKGALNHQ